MNSILECYLKLLDIPDPTQYPIAHTNSSSKIGKSKLCKQCPGTTNLQTLDEDIDGIICYDQPGSNPDEQGASHYHITCWTKQSNDPIK